MRKFKADKIFYEIPGYVRYFHRIWHFTQNSSMLSYDNKLYIVSYHTAQAADDDRVSWHDYPWSSMTSQKVPIPRFQQPHAPALSKEIQNHF